MCWLKMEIVAIVIMVFLTGHFELYEQYWIKIAKLFGKNCRCYTDFLNCFGEVFRSFSKYINFTLSVVVGDLIKLCSFFTDCVIVTLAKLIWKLQRMVSLLCNFSVFLLALFKTLSMLQKIETCKTPDRHQCRGYSGQGWREVHSILPWVLATLSFATASVSVNLIYLFLIRQQLRAVILMQLSPCIKCTLYKIWTFVM